MFDSIEMKRLLKMVNVFVIMLTIFLIAATLYAFKSYRNADLNTPINNTITVSGEGEVFAVPDIATFSFGAIASAKTVTDAQKTVTDKIAKALALIKGAGVDSKDIKTTDYSVSPKYEYQNFPCSVNSCPPSKQNLVGYEVSQNISVKVRKVEDAGKILESLGGTEVTNISGLQFTIDDQDKLEADARAKAINDAKTKAKVLARDLGVRLVRIVNFSESGDYPIFYGRATDAAMQSGMGGGIPSLPKAEIPVGQNKITSNISITYQIK